MESEYIDITPRGMTTPEGCKRVEKAQDEWNAAAHALANATMEFLDTHEDDMLAAMDKYERFGHMEGFREDLHQIRALIGAKRRKEHAFLLAVAGQEATK